MPRHERRAEGGELDSDGAKCLMFRQCRDSHACHMNYTPYGSTATFSEGNWTLQAYINSLQSPSQKVCGSIGTWKTAYILERVLTKCMSFQEQCSLSIQTGACWWSREICKMEHEVHEVCNGMRGLFGKPILTK